jgi:hypothetical protein
MKDGRRVGGRVGERVEGLYRGFGGIILLKVGEKVGGILW